MKCSNCGAEISSEVKVCPFCESEVVPDPVPVQPVQTTITNNYYGGEPKQEGTNAVCPKCGGNRIKFKREEIGSTKNKKNREVLYRTVGICQDCGYTWNPNSASNAKKHGALWWVLVILFFPISLSIWFFKTDKIKLAKKYRILILIAVWIVLIACSSHSSDKPSSTVDVPEIVETTKDTANSIDIETQEIEAEDSDSITKAQPTTTKAQTTAPATTAAPTTKVSVTDTGAVSPEFKKAMDSYEAFFDEYIAFMKKYQAASPEDSLSMMGDYAVFMQKYSETMQKISEIDESELSTADSLYYVEVTARINKKIASVA